MSHSRAPWFGDEPQKGPVVWGCATAAPVGFGTSQTEDDSRVRETGVVPNRNCFFDNIYKLPAAVLFPVHM